MLDPHHQYSTLAMHKLSKLHWHDCESSTEETRTTNKQYAGGPTLAQQEYLRAVVINQAAEATTAPAIPNIANMRTYTHT